MIIKKPNELRSYITEREEYLKLRGRMSVDLKNHEEWYSSKRQSMPMLDSKKIKSRLSEIFKQEKELNRISSTFQDGEKCKKQNFRQYFSRTFMKRKQKGQSYHHLTREKMEILSDEQQQPSAQPAFNIKEIKIRRKGSPFIPNSQKQSVDEIYADRYYRVLTFAKSKFKQEKLGRKPSIPEAFKIQENRQMENNFVKGKNKVKGGRAESKIGLEPLEPWAELDDSSNNQYDNCI